MPRMATSDSGAMLPLTGGNELGSGLAVCVSSVRTREREGCE